MAVARRFRVGGSKYTTFEWKGQTLALCDQVRIQAPQPVAQATAIQPLDEEHPLEIVTPAATGMGTIELDIVEVYGKKVWDELVGLSGANDLVEIFNAIAATADPIDVVKRVLPPAGSKVKAYAEVYHNCVIADLRDDETLQVGTLQIVKSLTINFTHSTRPK